ELTGHKPGGGNRELGGCLGGQFRKEDVLGALDGDTVDDSGTAHSGLPEGHIAHMVQAEGDQGTLDEAVKPGAHITGTQHQVAQRTDPRLDHVPDVAHAAAHHQIDGGGDDGHEAGAAKEGPHLGQLGLIEAVVQCRHAQTYDDTAEDAHLQGGDAQHGGGGVGGHGLHAAGGVDHGADGGVHDQVGNGTGESSDFLLFFGHTDGDAHGEEQGQVVEHGAAALVHDVQHRVDHGALVDDAGQAVSLQHGFV